MTSPQPPVVTLMTTAVGLGGVWRNMIDLACGLRDRGIAVRFELRPDAAALRDDASDHGFAWDRFGERPAPGVWHAHLANTYDVLAVRRILRVRATGSCAVVVTEHLPRTDASDPAVPPLQRSPGATSAKTLLKHAQFRASDATIAVSAASSRFLRTRYPRCGPIDVVQLALPDPLPPPGTGGSGDPRLVVSVGALIRQKGHDTLVQAAHRASGDWRVDIVGDGPGDGRLRALVTSLDVKDRVRLLGRRDDVPARMAAAGITCLPSRWEGFPYAGIEAMAVSRAVVASSADGLVEQVEHGVTGLHVPADDPSGLAAVLDDLTAQPARIASMGAAGRRRLEAHFTFDRMIAGTLDVYTRASVRSSDDHAPRVAAT